MPQRGPSTCGNCVCFILGVSTCQQWFCVGIRLIKCGAEESENKWPKCTLLCRRPKKCAVAVVTVVHAAAVVVVVLVDGHVAW